MDNWKLSAIEVVQKLPQAVRAMTEIVGKWVWITFPANPGRETIALVKDLGFHFNRQRKCWQHSGGCPSRHSDHNPRDKYIIQKADELIAA